MTPTSGHKEFLQNKRNWLNKVVSKSPKYLKTLLPCQLGWKLDITCAVELTEDPFMNGNLSYLLTNRLNQDCIENLFAVIGGKGGFRTNPDAREFRVSLSHPMVQNWLIQPKGSNCQADLDKTLFTLQNVTSLGTTSSLKKSHSENKVHKEIELLAHQIHRF